MEFPDRDREEAFFELFGCISDIIEVVIPTKRNKIWKCFSFTRLRDVDDERLFTIKLDYVIIDGKTIHTNFPWFLQKEHNIGKSFLLGLHETNLVKVWGKMD